MKNLAKNKDLNKDSKDLKEEYMDWEDSIPCNLCLKTRCTGPCDKYEKWLKKDPSKPIRPSKCCPTCHRPF